MTNKTKYDIFFVDNDSSICGIVAEDLKCIGCEVKCFKQTKDCLEQLPYKNCNLLITSLKLPEIDGLTLLSKVKRLAPWVPVMLVTAYGDVSMCSKAFRMGAVDFIEKPLEKKAFTKRVKTILEKNYCTNSNLGKPLTNIEKKVLKLILDGQGNKQIAFKLNLSLRSAERHRSSIMHKFRVDNIVELVKKSSLISMETIA